jgi:DNA invertase Pin-like site-specific DNA recombinase
MKMGLYARVSTHDQQTLALQRDAMTAYVKQRGGSIVTIVEDVGYLITGWHTPATAPDG